MLLLLFYAFFANKQILVYCITAEKNSIAFSDLFSLIVPKDNLLRKVSGLIDFTLV